MEKQRFIPKLTCFYCVNAFDEEMEQSLLSGVAEIKFIKLACSSMVKDIYLLNAFEAGADGVTLLVCPDNTCRYVKGNFRAKKRIEWVKGILDDINFNGNRLSIYSTSSINTDETEKFFHDVVNELLQLGPNPATQAAP